MSSNTPPESSATTPSWIDIAGYSIEKLHTNVLARSLTSSTPAAAELAAALWKLASDESVAPAAITALHAQCEHRLKRGAHSVVDLLVTFVVDGSPRHLAVEVKVDGPPDGTQLESMATSFVPGPHRHLVLLCMGGAQVCRIEAEQDLLAKNLVIRRLAVKDILQLGKLVEAASPAPGVTRDWLAELADEERRRTEAFEDGAATRHRYRGRSLDVYRYRLAADAMASDNSGSWDVSVQPFGVVMTERSKQRTLTFKGATVKMYLQVVDGVLRVKAGTRSESADPRAATEAALAALRVSLEKHGFTVENPRQTSGKFVSLLTIDPHDASVSRDNFVPKLRRAYTAWCSTPWPT